MKQIIWKCENCNKTTEPFQYLTNSELEDYLVSFVGNGTPVCETCDEDMEIVEVIDVMVYHVQDNNS